MSKIQIAAAIPPGEFIQDELDERGWTQEDFARITGRPPQSLNEIIKGRKSITVETARQIAAAFGTSPDFWLNLESAYQLARASQPTADIAQRAKLFEFAPVKELEKRGWVSPTKTAQELENELCRFFRISALDEPLALRVAARQSVNPDSLSGSQVAWAYRALHLARGVQAASYSPAKLRSCLPELRALTRQPESARHVPKVLAKAGVRLVVIEQLQRSKMDGAALWSDNMPVIALSLRFGRMDWFWFTLMHEIDHVLNEGPDSPMLDVDLSKDAEPWSIHPDIEARANANAANALIDRDEMESFVDRVAPYFSKERIIKFANRIKVHPSIIVGQLQHLGQIGWHANRGMLVDIREHIIGIAMTDGFGLNPELR